MNCKYCNAELVDGNPFCPSCGKAQSESEETAAESVVETAEETVSAVEAVETETAESAAENVPFETDYEAAEEETEAAPKASVRKIVAAVVAGVLVVAILIGLLMGGMNNGVTTPTIAPTAGTVAPTEPVEIPSNGDPASALCKESYTVSDDEALAAADVVVATMGDVELTNGELQAYYWMEVFAFLQEYGSYAEYFGLDVTRPLDTQLCELGEEPTSWQQFFLDSAIYSWKSYQSMAMEADKANYQLPAERQAELDSLPKDLQTTAETGGFESVEDLIAHNVGAGCSLDDYFSYINTYYKGLSYYFDCCDKIAPSEDEISAYFDENKEVYAEDGIVKNAKYVDVRHVLLQPEGGETGADGSTVYTDEAWEACRREAEALYNKWQEGDKSEESFAALANENTDDGNDSNGDGQPDGGLYENVTLGRMVEEFENWCFDETRKTGDHGLIKSSYGYHIMYFCDSRPMKYVDVRHVLLQPEGGETGEDGYPVFTDEAWETCRQEAEALYNKWQEGDKSEESFAALANENTDDGNDSNGDGQPDGGLYENVYKNMMVPEFDSWCFDEARQVGDHDLIKTVYGYHIMYFSDSHEIWYVNAEADLINSIAYDLIPETIEKYPAEVDYSAMKLAVLQLA